MKLWEKNFEINKEIERFTVGRDREMDLYLASRCLRALVCWRRMNSVSSWQS